MYFWLTNFFFFKFGRKKKKYRGKSVGPASILKEVEDKESEGEEEDEDEDLSKYKLDEVSGFIILFLLCLICTMTCRPLATLIKVYRYILLCVQSVPHY